MGCEQSQVQNEFKLQAEPEAKPSFVENVRSFRVREQPKKKDAKKIEKEPKFEDISSDVKLQLLVVHVKNVFNKYDSHDKGFLDEEDFTKLLKNQTNQDFSQKEVEDLIEKIDKNKNHLIEENELLYLFQELLPREQKK